ncbi:hypothetical protein HNQ56_002152 [Anaerotaenia torta]
MPPFRSYLWFYIILFKGEVRRIRLKNALSAGKYEVRLNE